MTGKRLAISNSLPVKKFDWCSSGFNHGFDTYEGRDVNNVIIIQITKCEKRTIYFIIHYLTCPLYAYALQLFRLTTVYFRLILVPLMLKFCTSNECLITCNLQPLLKAVGMSYKISRTNFNMWMYCWYNMTYITCICRSIAKIIINHFFS